MKTTWTELLRDAVITPGLISQAYSAFHNYSLGNQLAALMQCRIRNLQPGPLSTFAGWKKLGRSVRKGEKAIWLRMPITVKRCHETSKEEGEVVTAFAWKPNWFVLNQTVGDPVPIPAIPQWDADRALLHLEIRRAEFEHLDGNTMGYARCREIAISPLAPMPHKTMFHEMAHIVLGHTQSAAFSDGAQTPRNLREVEAESVALLLCESLGLSGAEYCRGYIQAWLQADVIPDESARKIFHAADTILKAGQMTLN